VTGETKGPNSHVNRERWHAPASNRLELRAVEQTLVIAPRRFLGSANEPARVFAFHLSLFTFHNLVSLTLLSRFD
jgi:hypothetical protein